MGLLNVLVVLYICTCTPDFRIDLLLLLSNPSSLLIAPIVSHNCLILNIKGSKKSDGRHAIKEAQTRAC